MFCLCVYLWVPVPVEVRRGVTSSGPCLPLVVNHHVGDGIQIQVLSRRSKCFYPLSQLSNSTTIIFKMWKKIVFLAVRDFIFFFPQLWTPHLTFTMNFIQILGICIFESFQLIRLSSIYAIKSCHWHLKIIFFLW